MITIGQKNKILLFDISTEGIDSGNLEFWFRIHCEEVTYSFKGELIDNNKVKITILPLTEMVKPKYLDFSKVYHSNLEVIGDGKYSLTTWEGDIQLEAPPRIDVKLENVQEEIRKVITEDKKKEEPQKKIIEEEKKPPAKIEVKMSDIIEEDTKVVEESNNPVSDGELEDLKYTRTSLLEDILGTARKKPNVVTKINELIK